jgi:hypothetical protein
MKKLNKNTKNSNKCNSKEKMPSFMEWYEKQPEYMYFMLANKIENFFEKSKLTSEYKEKQEIHINYQVVLKISLG